LQRLRTTGVDPVFTDCVESIVHRCEAVFRGERPDQAAHEKIANELGCIAAHHRDLAEATLRTGADSAGAKIQEGCDPLAVQLPCNGAPVFFSSIHPRNKVLPVPQFFFKVLFRSLSVSFFFIDSRLSCFFLPLPIPISIFIFGSKLDGALLGARALNLTVYGS